MTPAGFDLPIRIFYGGKGYEVTRTVHYHSPRYNKDVTAPRGMVYDGATGVPDIQSAGPLFHDVLCLRGTWDDGTPCSNLEASWVIHDIMKKEGRWGRSRTWFAGTLILRPISNFFESLNPFKGRGSRKATVTFPVGWTLGMPWYASTSVCHTMGKPSSTGTT